MFTDMTVPQAKATGKPYTIADFDGLSLFVSATGAKTWHFRYTWVGPRAHISWAAIPSCRCARPGGYATRHAAGRQGHQPAHRAQVAALP